jgi:hypothetical protein
MGYLTVPYRVIYESKGLSGLTNVKAMVFKPDNALAGPFAMAELPNPLLGIYYFDFYTSDSDPQGEYFAVVASPTEGIRYTVRMSMYGLPEGAADISPLIRPDIIGKVLSNNPISGVVMESDAIQGSLNNPNLIATVQGDETIIGLVPPADNILANFDESGTIIGNVSDEENIT